MKNPLYLQRAYPWAHTFNRQKTAVIMRGLAPALSMFAFASAAHAQGTIDFGGATTFLTSIRTWCLLAGATIVLISLVFVGMGLAAKRFTEAFAGLGGALFGALVIGYGPGWIASLTNQAVQ